MSTIEICIEKYIKIIYLFSYKKLFTTFYLMICDFSKKKFGQKNLENLMIWDKMEARFGFSTENYSKNHIVDVSPIAIPNL